MAPESNLERPDPPGCRSVSGLCRSTSGPSLATSHCGNETWNTSDHSLRPLRWGSKMLAPGEFWVRLGSGLILAEWVESSDR